MVIFVTVILCWFTMFFMLGEGAGMAIYILHCDDCDGSDDIHES